VAVFGEGGSMITKYLLAHAWVGEMTFVFFGTIFLVYVVEIFAHHITPRLSSSRIISNKILFYALHRPLQIGGLILGTYFAINVLHFHVGMDRIFSAIMPTKNVALLITVVWFFLRLLSKSESELIIRRAIKSTDIARLDIIFKVLRMLVVLSGLVVLLPMLSIDISGLLTVGGVGGILVGFMAKDVLTNTVGGLMVYIDRPFAKGDWIRLPDRNVEGTVDHIAWRLTAIRLLNQQLLYVPNAVFMTTPVENFSRMKKRRLTIEAEVRYKKTAQITEITQTFIPALEVNLAELEGIEETKPVQVNVIGLEDLMCRMSVKIYIKIVEKAHIYALQQDILLKIFDTVSKHGFECKALIQK
jgi:MscS family membrane protein